MFYVAVKITWQLTSHRLTNISCLFYLFFGVTWSSFSFFLPRVKKHEPQIMLLYVCMYVRYNEYIESRKFMCTGWETSADIIYFDFIVSMCIYIYSCMTYCGWSRDQVIQFYYFIMHSCERLTYFLSLLFVKGWWPNIIYSLTCMISIQRVSKENR